MFPKTELALDHVQTSASPQKNMTDRLGAPSATFLRRPRAKEGILEPDRVVDKVATKQVGVVTGLTTKRQEFDWKNMSKNVLKAAHIW